MSPMFSSLRLPAVRNMAEHIVNCLMKHRSRFPVEVQCPPLFVGVQGPQGSGKTFMTLCLREQFALLPNPISVAVLSIDDLYLPREGLVTLAATHPANRLLQGRGHPGTHDVELGCALLEKIQVINILASNEAEVELPIFDKSLFNGEGDRLPHGRILRPPVDVFILEGWCVGFYPASEAVVEKRWNESVPGLEGQFNMQTFTSKEHVLAINERLRAYKGLWDMLDVFIQIKGPSSHSLKIIYKWRMQQEHDMKEKNGGRGMTDEQVAAFVDRYIPGYVFWEDTIIKGCEYTGTSPRWLGKGLTVVIGEDREFIATSRF